jgi:hypothetical protein
MPISEAKIRANKKFDKKAYDTLGAKTRKGIKDIVGLISAENNITVSDFIKEAVSEYAQKLVGTDILTNSLEDLDKILKYVNPPSIEFNHVYINKSDFNFLLELRDRAANNYPNEVPTKEEFTSRFKDGNTAHPNSILGKLEPAKSFNELIRKKFNIEEYYITDESIYKTLYTLVYQANSK